MPAYCLFCETQKCVTIAHVIERSWGIRCISPMIIQRKWIKGIAKEVRHPLLPGYIFLYMEKPFEKSFRIPGIIRILGNGELEGTDLAFAAMLWEQNGVIGTIHLTDTGDGFIVADSRWREMNGEITKVDRERKRCCIVFSFDSIQRRVWLGYELVKTSETRNDANSFHV